MKPVLFIAYHFPPAGGAGVQRSLKYVKYLPEFEWQPIVITTTPEAYPVHDESLWNDIPAHTPIYRTKSYDINGLRPAFGRLHLGKLLTALNIALMLPDAAMLWSRLARAAVRRAVVEYQPALIYSSSGPASAHLLALWAHNTFGLPWVADWRDPWSGNRLMPFLPGYRHINAKMEQRVLTNAEQIVTVSQPLADHLRDVSGRQDLSVQVIENGYDEDDVQPLPPQETDQFTITYTGTFSRLRRPDDFIAAIDQLIARAEVDPDRMRVIVAGKDTDKYIPDRPPFERLGYVSHDGLRELRRQTNLFLFLQDNLPESKGAFSGKLFEYLGSNRPTLAITYRGNVGAELVERAQAGTSTTYDPDAIAEVILRYCRAWQMAEANFSPRWEIIHQYRRRDLTARLAAEFDRLVQEPR